MFSAQLKRILENVHRICSGLVTDPEKDLSTAEIAITSVQRNAQDLSQSISSANQSLNAMYKKAQQQKQALEIEARKKQQILFAQRLLVQKQLRIQQQLQQQRQLLMMQRLRQQMQQKISQQPKLAGQANPAVKATGVAVPVSKMEASPGVRAIVPGAGTSQHASSSSLPTIPSYTPTNNSVPSSSDKKSSYIVQMVQLTSMGFTDREANLRALRRTNGDVVGAHRILKDPEQRKTLENEPLPPG